MARNIPSNEKQRPEIKTLYPARLSIKMEGEIRSFLHKTRLKEYTSTKPALQNMLKGLLEEDEEKEWERRIQLQKGKMLISKYLSVITWNINGLNALIKGHRIAWMDNKTWPAHMLIQETHLTKKDLHRQKVKGWKKYSKKMDSKKRQGSNTYIRQSRLQNKGHEKRPRRTLHNMQGKNLPRKKMNIISIYAPNIGQPKI